MKKTIIYATTLSSIMFSLVLSASAAYQPKFSTAGFYQLEGTGQNVYSMNVAWRFIKTDVSNAEASGFDDSKWEVVSLPHRIGYSFSVWFLI